MAEYLTNDTDLTKVADAIRAKDGTVEQLEYPDGFVAAIGNIYAVDTSAAWNRPWNWPDYDSLHLRDNPNDHSIYLTYDTTAVKIGGRAGARILYAAGTTIKRGKIINGAFVAEETLVENTTNTNDAQLALDFTAEDDDYIVIQFNGPKLLFGGNDAKWLANNTSIDSCVEIYGRADTCEMFYYNISYIFSFFAGVRAITLLDFSPTTLTLGSNYMKPLNLEYMNISEWNLPTIDVMSYESYISYSRLISFVLPDGFPPTSSLKGFASNTTNLQMIDLHHLDVSTCTNFDNFASSARSLYSVDISGWDMVNAGANINPFAYSPVVEIKTTNTKIYKSINFGDCEQLNHDSAVGIIAALQTAEDTQVLKLNAKTKALLTSEEIAVATEKGWTVA